MERNHLTISETARMVKDQEVSCEELVSESLEKIRILNPDINAFVTVSGAQALHRARQIDKKVRAHERVGRLCGVTVAVKDNICTSGVPTTCGSRMLEKYSPPYNATVIEKANAEGGIVVGKTNMDEFGMGTTTENSYFGATRNPIKKDHVAGGSSGGSAAAIRAEMAMVSLGEDTGGSIRCPASYCGIVGLKPSYGLVSRYGLIAYAHSLEQIGPMGATVEDCALLLDAIVGNDPQDGTSVQRRERSYFQSLDEGIEGLTIGLPKQFFGGGTTREVAKSVRNAVSKLEGMGAACEETSLDSLDVALASYYVIATAEASSNLARFDGLRYGCSDNKKLSDWETTFTRNRTLGFGPEVKRRILLGTYVLSAGYFDEYYIKAQRVRSLIRREFERSFKKFDVVIGPTMPTPPPRLGEKTDPLEMYSMDVNTVPANLTGLPALSVPCGIVDGLPVGMQIFAPMFKDELTLRVGRAFEKSSKRKLN